MEPILIFLILGFIFIFALLFLIYIFIRFNRRLGKGRSVKILLKDFNRKIWMTTCLGISFFGFYFLMVMVGAPIIRSLSNDLFVIVYRNPIKFVYLGLCLFAILSLTIYFVRMIIKYLYLTRGQDN